MSKCSGTPFLLPLPMEPPNTLGMPSGVVTE